MSVTLFYPYCTLADAKFECHLKTAEFDDDIRNSINGASRWIDGFTRRDFQFHDHSAAALTVPEHWIAENKIYLPWPAITLTEVKCVDRFGVETVMEATDYRVEAGYQSVSGIIARDGRWHDLPAHTSDGLVPQRRFPLPPKILLKGTFGYAEVSGRGSTEPSPNLPYEIRRACTVVASVFSGLYRKSIVSEGGSAETVTVKNIPREVLDSLKRYVVPLV